MSLENKIENEINCIEGAKIIMPHLKVKDVEIKLSDKLKINTFFLGTALMRRLMSTVEGIHTAYLFCTSKEGYCKNEKEQKRLEMERRKKEDEKFEKSLSENEISEEAFKIAQFTGVALDGIIFHAKGYTYVPIEITKSKPNMQYVSIPYEPSKYISTLKEVGITPLEIRMQKQNFELILEAAIKDGIHVAEDHFYGSISGFPRQFNNVELNIPSVKKELLDKIYQSCEQGKVLTFLEDVEIRTEQEYIYMGYSEYYTKKRVYGESE